MYDLSQLDKEVGINLRWKDWDARIAKMGTGTLPSYATKINRYTIFNDTLEYACRWYNFRLGTAGSGSALLVFYPPIYPAKDWEGKVGNFRLWDGANGSVLSLSAWIRYDVANKYFVFQYSYDGSLMPCSFQSQTVREILIHGSYEITN